MHPREKISLAQLRGSESNVSGAEYLGVYAAGAPIVVETESSEKSKLLDISDAGECASATCRILITWYIDSALCTRENFAHAGSLSRGDRAWTMISKKYVIVEKNLLALDACWTRLRLREYAKRQRQMTMTNTLWECARQGWNTYMYSVSG